jgi:hypothetical protein
LCVDKLVALLRRNKTRAQQTREGYSSPPPSLASGGCETCLGAGAGAGVVVVFVVVVCSPSFIFPSGSTEAAERASIVAHSACLSTLSACLSLAAVRAASSARLGCAARLKHGTLISLRIV